MPARLSARWSPPRFSFAPGQYRLLFALTIIPGVIAVALLFRVEEPGGPRPLAPEAHAHATTPAQSLPRPLLGFFAVLFVFSLGNSADAFLLLRLSDSLGSATFVPLIWSALHVVKASLSTWGGALSDRLGRKRVIVLGWATYAVVYLGFARTERPEMLIAWFLVYGACISR